MRQEAPAAGARERDPGPADAVVLPPSPVPGEAQASSERAAACVHLPPAARQNPEPPWLRLRPCAARAPGVRHPCQARQGTSLSSRVPTCPKPAGASAPAELCRPNSWDEDEPASRSQAPTGSDLPSSGPEAGGPGTKRGRTRRCPWHGWGEIRAGRIALTVYENPIGWTWGKRPRTCWRGQCGASLRRMCDGCTTSVWFFRMRHLG